MIELYRLKKSMGEYYKKGSVWYKEISGNNGQFVSYNEFQGDMSVWEDSWFGQFLKEEIEDFNKHGYKNEYVEEVEIKDPKFEKIVYES